MRPLRINILDLLSQKLAAGTKSLSESTMIHLIDFGVCALAGRINFIILHNYFKKIF